MTDVSGPELAHLGFQRVEPSNSLREFIECYWFIDATCTQANGYQEFLHPDGGMGLIFNYGDTLSFNGEQKQTHTSLDGATTRTIELGLGGCINAVGIRFKPAGASVFMGLPLSELKNHQLDVTDVKLKHLSGLYNILPSQKTLFTKIMAIEHALMKSRQEDKHISHLVHAAIDGITRTRGALAMNDLAKQLNLSQRKLERLFKAQLGLSPGEFAKTVRVEHARHSLKNTDISFADLACHLGFYDQAHFVKSFKSVVGLTPGQYRQRCERAAEPRLA